MGTPPSSAIHDALSKRQRAKRSTARKIGASKNASPDSQLTKRVSELERRYDRLLGGLEELLRRAKKG